MRILFVLTCCVALAPVARAADQDQDNNHKKKHAEQTSQTQQQQVVTPKGHKGTNTSHLQTNTSQLQNQHNVSTAPLHTHLGGQSNVNVQQNTNVRGRHGGVNAQTETNVSAGKSSSVNFHARHFDLANKPKPEIQNVKFRANNRIQGSEHWEGQHYQAFRNYRSEWHDRDWWEYHHPRIVVIFGGPYFWDGGYWYPAWGYEPNAYYAYDGPIYAGNAEMDPGQVVANVQAALQAQGYYHGEVDGILGPLTRGALLRYQEAHGLYPTEAIDEPTLASLGMA